MIKKSLPIIAFVGIGHLVNSLLALILISAGAAKLPVNEFGFYMLVTSLLVFVAKFTDFGTNNIYVTKALKIETSQELISAFFSTKVLLSLITLPISLIISKVYSFDLKTLLIFILGVFFYMLNFSLYSIFQKYEKYWLLIITNFIPAIIKGTFGLFIFLNLISNVQATTYIAVFALSVLPSIALIWFLPPEYKKLRFNFSNVRSYLLLAFPAGTSQMISESLSNISNISAKYFGGNFSVGIYSIADKMSAIFSLASISVFTVLLPKNSLRKKDKLKYDYIETGIIAGLILILAVLAIFVSHFFLQIAFGDKFDQSIGIVSVLIFAYALTAIHSFMENYFFVEDKTDKLLKISLTKLTVVLICTFVLGNMYGLYGIAWAQLIAAVSAVCITLSYIGNKA